MPWGAPLGARFGWHRSCQFAVEFRTAWEDQNENQRVWVGLCPRGFGRLLRPQRPRDRGRRYESLESAEFQRRARSRGGAWARRIDDGGCPQRPHQGDGKRQRSR